MLENSDKAVLIKWGLKPNVMRDLGLLNCNIKECVDLVIEMISSGRVVSNYVDSSRGKDSGYLNMVRKALVGVMEGRYDNLGEGLESEEGKLI